MTWEVNVKPFVVAFSPCSDHILTPIFVYSLEVKPPQIKRDENKQRTHLGEAAGPHGQSI